MDNVKSINLTHMWDGRILEGMNQRHPRPETLALHPRSGSTPQRGPVATPIYQSATFRFLNSDMDQGRPVSQVLGDSFYTRYGNPTNSVAESLLAELEGGEAALVFSSGMAAITSAVLSVVRSGDHVVAQRELYGGAFDFLIRWLPKFGVGVSFVPAADPPDFAAAIRPTTRLLYLESPSNPTLQVAGLAELAAMARRRGILTFVDNTAASPINQRPLELGADVVVHSASKYLAGHSDIVAGAAVGSRTLIDALREERTVLGGCLDPHAAWLLIRGIKTLGVRMDRINQNALELARFLEGHPRVKQVHYPFLESHPQYALARAQMRGGGGLLSVELRGTAGEARRFVESLHLFAQAPSLGGVESLVTLPASTSHTQLSPVERQEAGIGDNLVRMSVGLEHIDDLTADIEQALQAAVEEVVP